MQPRLQIAWFAPLPAKAPWGKRYNFNKTLPSVWIRCLQLIPYLEPLGISSLINQYSDSTAVAIFLRKYDKGAQQLAQELKRGGVKIVVDIPINFFSEDKLEGLETHEEFRSQFLKISKSADVITCPSSFIKEAGEREGHPTVCLEDSVHRSHFKYEKSPFLNNKRPRLIWSGKSVKAGALNFLAPAIKANEWPVIVISDQKPQLDFPYEFMKWRYERFPQDLLKGDIGIFPRQTNSDYDKGHSFFKIAVLLAQKIPVVCNPLPSYYQVANESNSIFLNDMDLMKWEQAVNAIHRGQASLDFSNNPVTEIYTAQKIAEKYRDFLYSLCAQPLAYEKVL